MKVAKLRLKDFVARGDWSHVGRTEFSQGRGVAYHTHDFAEVFWVEKGRGEHRRNAKTEPLEAGTVCFVRPEDAHGFDARKNAGVSILNVAFEWRVVEDLRRRYEKEFEGLAWSKVAQVGARGAEGLSRQAVELARHPGSRAELDRLLLEVLLLTRRGIEPAGMKRVPGWLEEGRRRFDSPEQFARGVEGFAELTGRSPEHVNRTLRAVLGMTTTQYINEARLEWARRQLGMTETSVTRVALDAGFENVSYFIRIFKTRHGVTPGEYRERSRGTLPVG